MNTHIGNVVLIVGKPAGCRTTQLLMGKKRPKKKDDQNRKRKKIGSNCWVPPGGGTESYDKSQKHAAQREILQETGLSFPLKSFKKVGVLRGFISSQTEPLWIVHLYLVVEKFNRLFVFGEEYVDMKWFPVTKLPFRHMLPGDIYWIPRLIKGEMLAVDLCFKDEVGVLESKDIRAIDSFN